MSGELCLSIAVGGLVLLIGLFVYTLTAVSARASFYAGEEADYRRAHNLSHEADG